MRAIILLCLLLAFPVRGFAYIDSLKPHSLEKPQSAFVQRMEKITSSRAYRMTYIGVPLIVTGIIIQERDRGFRYLRNDYIPTFRYHYDDYLQYAPAALMLGLKAGGVKGRSSWGRMLVSDAFSAALMAGAVNTLKYTCKMTRPDGSNRHSFPSGHTATAFMTATMLYKEYGARSPWYSIAGYSMATATGVSRMLNNKHWLSDVMVGAGIGILSVELGYLFADLIYKDRGRNDLSKQDYEFLYDRFRCPSFLGIDEGLEVIMGHYRPASDMHVTFEVGISQGIEGAWFLSPYVGIGGRIAVSSSPLRVNHEMSIDRLSGAMACLGGYISYPLSSRWLVGGKVQGGYLHYKALSSDQYLLGKIGGPVFGAGTSMTFRANYNLDLRFQTTYYLQPPMRHGSDQYLNTMHLSITICMAF